MASLTTFRAELWKTTEATCSGRRRSGRGGSAAVGQGQGRAWRDRGATAVAGRDWAGQSEEPPGPGRQCEEHLAMTMVRVEAIREREARERKGGTIPAYVHRVDTSANEHKQADLRDGRGALCSSATRRT
jgi:hypothetical protein